MIPGRDFMVFVLIGGFTSMSNLLVRVLLDPWAGYEVAIVLRFATGVTAAYIVNRALVFRSAGPEWRTQVVRYLIVNVVTIGHGAGDQFAVRASRLSFCGNVF
jgi:putative flippase GtrA